MAGAMVRPRWWWWLQNLSRYDWSVSPRDAATACETIARKAEQRLRLSITTLNVRLLAALVAAVTHRSLGVCVHWLQNMKAFLSTTNTVLLPPIDRSIDRVDTISSDLLAVSCVVL